MRIRKLAALLVASVLSCTVGAFAADVKLSWAQPVQTGVTITAYNVYRSTTSGGEAPPGLGSVQITGGNLATTYTDLNVPPGTYFYKITAYCNSCTGTKESLMSNEVQAVVPQSVIIVGPPVLQAPQVIVH